MADNLEGTPPDDASTTQRFGPDFEEKLEG